MHELGANASAEIRGPPMDYVLNALTSNDHATSDRPNILWNKVTP